MTLEKPNKFLETVLDIVVLKDRPELLHKLDHWDRKIIVVLLRSSSSSVAIAQEIKLNRKTVRMRLKKLKRIGLVSERPSRNSMFCISESFEKDVSEVARYVFYNP